MNADTKKLFTDLLKACFVLSVGGEINTIKQYTNLMRPLYKLGLYYTYDNQIAKSLKAEEDNTCGISTFHGIDVTRLAFFTAINNFRLYGSPFNNDKSPIYDCAEYDEIIVDGVHALTPRNKSLKVGQLAPSSVYNAVTALSINHEKIKLCDNCRNLYLDSTIKHSCFMPVNIHNNYITTVADTGCNGDYSSEDISKLMNAGDSVEELCDIIGGDIEASIKGEQCIPVGVWDEILDCLNS